MMFRFLKKQAMQYNKISLLWGKKKVYEYQWYSFLYKQTVIFISSLINNKLVTGAVKKKKKTVNEFKVISN